MFVLTGTGEGGRKAGGEYDAEMTPSSLYFIVTFLISFFSSELTNLYSLFLSPSPVPVRTNMTSTYPACTPISPILSSPTSPISSSFRVSFSTQKKGKISDVVEKKYETQLDVVFNNKVEIGRASCRERVCR